MEKKITCPICFSDEKCFEEQQKDWSSYMCFNCGFTSNSMYKPDTEDLKKAVDGATQLMLDISFYDIDRDITWFPSIVNMDKLGVIYPEGTKNNWVYKLATPRNLTTEEKKDSKYEGHTQILDVESATEYGQYEFVDALKKMGVVQEI